MSEHEWEKCCEGCSDIYCIKCGCDPEDAADWCVK